LLFFALVAYGQQERIVITNTVDDLDSIGISDLTYLTGKLRETAIDVLPKSRYGVITTESLVNADYVVQTHIGRFGGNLTIKAELYSSENGNLLGSFSGESKDILGLPAIINDKAPDLFKKMPGTSGSISGFFTNLMSRKPQQEQNQDSLIDMEPRVKVQRLIKKGLNRNKEEILMESFYLTYTDKEALYNMNRKLVFRSVGAAALNFFVGFGLGSYIQGNISSGVKQSVIDGLGYSLLLLAITNEQILLAGFSAFCLVPSRITGLIIPFSYQRKYNRTLKTALNYNHLSYSIDPLIVPRNGMPAVGLAFNLH
jgi:hypothetical protein